MWTWIGESYLEKLLQVNIELMYNNNKEKSEKIGSGIVFPFNGIINNISYQQNCTILNKIVYSGPECDIREKFQHKRMSEYICMKIITQTND